MEISRLIFSKETKEKMNTKLTNYEKRRLLMSKLKEISDDGQLAMCRTRRDVASMVGYTTEKAQAGYVWVTSLINEGVLKETVMGIDDRGYMEYDYKFIEKPAIKRSENKTTNKETNKMPKKKLSKRREGQLRWEKLMSNVVDGKLPACKSRKDVAKLAGYTGKKMRIGYSWVANMITREHLIERRVGTDNDGLSICEYRIGSQPNYELRGARSKTRECDNEKRENTQCIPEPTQSASVVITYGELKIELNEVSPDVIKDVIANMFNKVKGE